MKHVISLKLSVPRRTVLTGATRVTALISQMLPPARSDTKASLRAL